MEGDEAHVRLEGPGEQRVSQRVRELPGIGVAVRPLAEEVEAPTVSVNADPDEVAGAAGGGYDEGLPQLPEERDPASVFADDRKTGPQKSEVQMTVLGRSNRSCFLGLRPAPQSLLH